MNALKVLSDTNNILTYDFPPEFLQSFRTLSIANIDYPATVQIHDNRVVLIQIYNIYSGFFFILSVLSLQIPEEPFICDTESH